jgi:hydrogenase maturation factor
MNHLVESLKIISVLLWPVMPETAEICAALGLDAWGLLASGALLLAVAPEACAAMQERLAAVAGGCRCIGRVAAEGAGVIMDERGTATPLRRFGRDELARYFDE